MGDIMNWLKLFLDWELIGKKEGLGKKYRKIEVLLKVATPVMEEIEKEEIIEHWDHSFQGAKGDLSHGAISILISTKEAPENVTEELRDQLTEFHEKKHFDFKIGPPKQMIKF